MSEALGVRKFTARGGDMIWRNFAALSLLVIGLTQIAGDLFGSRVLKGIGAATAIAPCPKVFCDINGWEAFASTFELITDGDEHISVRITPELYARLKGPYNRRNVYGAAIAAAPRLPEPIWRSVLCYAFRSPGVLRPELGLPEPAKCIRIILRTNTRDRNECWVSPCIQ